MKELVWHRQLLPAVERWSARPFLTDLADPDRPRTTTYEEHGRRVLRLADALSGELGVRPDDRVAVLSLNSARYEELYHAALLGTCVLNPLNLRFAPRELVHVLRDSGTEVVFVDAAFAPVLDAVREAAGVRTVVLMDRTGDVPHDHGYEALLAAGRERVPAEPEEDAAALLMYTGGTTGLPKGVLLDQRAVVLTLYHVQMVRPLEQDDVYLAQVPMFHAASMGAVVASPVGGGRLVTVPAFDPERVLAAVEAHGVTNTIMVPTMLAMTFASPGYRAERLAGLQRLTYGASPMPRPVLERLLADVPHLRLSQGYGMTESAALVSSLTPEDHDRGGAVLASAGRPVVGVTVTVQDELGTVLPVGETGEVCARGGNFMREYWRRPDETAEAFRDGWYHTGDAGRLDEEGYLYLVDRVKDMIVSGGENVYSTEVEQAVASHPAVGQVAVIGVPDDTWGEAVHAVVVLRPGASATQDEITAHVREQIAGYKVPKSVEFRTEPLPLSGAMKVLKRELREPFRRAAATGSRPRSDGRAPPPAPLQWGDPLPAPARSPRVPVIDGLQDDPAHAPDELEPPVGEECGVFGVWAPDEDVAKLTYYGLYALQHRGQEAAGMAVSDGSAVLVYKDLGLVAQVFDEGILSSLRGHLAIGHTRYSTTGAGTWENAQPSFRNLPEGASSTRGAAWRWATTATSRTPPSWPGAPRRSTRGCPAWAPPPTATSSPPCSRPTPGGPTRPRSRCCRPSRARTAWCSWTRAPSTRPATRTASARSCSAGSPAAGSWPARRPRSTSSARRSCARSSRASCWRSTPTASAAPASPRPPPRAACSSTSTSPARTPRSPASPSTRPGCRSGARSPSRRRSTPTSSSRCRSPAPRARSASPSRAASRTAWGW